MRTKLSLITSFLFILSIIGLMTNCVSESKNPEPTATPGATSPVSTSGTPTPAGPLATYKPSQQVFDETFMAVKKLIDELNLLIKNGDYQAWLEMLSPEYRAYFSKPEILSQQNDSKILQSKGLAIKTIEDYFRNVVAPSRASVRLDDLVFINEREVEAIMQVGNRRVTIYSLINIKGNWKIGLSKNGQ